VEAEVLSVTLSSIAIHKVYIIKSEFICHQVFYGFLHLVGIVLAIRKANKYYLFANPEKMGLKANSQQNLVPGGY